MKFQYLPAFSEYVVILQSTQAFHLGFCWPLCVYESCMLQVQLIVVSLFTFRIFVPFWLVFLAAHTIFSYLFKPVCQHDLSCHRIYSGNEQIPDSGSTGISYCTIYIQMQMQMQMYTPIFCMYKYIYMDCECVCLLAWKDFSSFISSYYIILFFWLIFDAVFAHFSANSHKISAKLTLCSVLQPRQSNVFIFLARDFIHLFGIIEQPGRKAAKPFQSSSSSCIFFIVSLYEAET